MRIVVNNIAASKGGAMTVLKDFYSCVCENDKENEWIFLLGDKYFEETDNVKIIALPQIKKNPIKKVLFDLLTGKKFIGNLKPDVVFSMQNIITFGLKVPQVVYVHQPLPFQTIKRFSFFKSNERSLAFKQMFVGALIKKSIKKAQRVIVQTDWMRDAVLKKCSVEAQKVIKIRPNVKNLSAQVNDMPFDNTSFFYPTSAVLYKNNDLISSVSKILDEKKIKHSFELTLPEEKSKGNVKCIGRIPYESVIEKYCSSTLVFPSYIETFGYPLAEARQVGTVIIAADTPFARELLLGYENAYFFDYNNKEQLADLMQKVICGEIKKQPINDGNVVLDNCWIEVLKTVLLGE